MQTQNRISAALRASRRHYRRLPAPVRLVAGFAFRAFVRWVVLPEIWEALIAVFS